MSAFTASLESLCFVQSGGTPSRGKPEFWGGDVPWVKITDMRGGIIDRTEECITDAGLCSSAAKVFPRGTLLLSIFATIGRTALLGIDAATNQAIAGLTIKKPDLVDPGYLKRYLDFAAPSLASQGRGVAQANINLTILRSTKVPLPALSEQRRIAAILDKADALRAKRREAIAKLDQLLQSVFLDMFGDSKRWPTVEIGDVCEVKGGKRLPKGEDYAEFATPYRYVRVSDIEMGCVHEERLKYLKPQVQERIKRYTVAEGDVVITIAGTIGVVAPVGSSLQGANLTENAAKLVPRNPGSYVAEFMAFALSRPEAQSQIRSQTGQVTIGKLALFRIEKVVVPLPPVSDQQRFSKIAKKVEQQRRILANNARELDTLCASLQHRAFTGFL